MARKLKRPKSISTRRNHALTELYGAAVTLMHADRQQEVRQLVDRMLGIDPNYAPAWDILSASLSTGENAVETELAARRALSLNSRLQSASIALGVALLKQRRFQEGALHCGKAVQEYPDSVPMWSNLAAALASLGQNANAEFCYRRVLELDPANTPARVQLANILLLLARGEEAKAELSVASEHAGPLLELRQAQIITAVPTSEDQILAERERFAREIERLSETLPSVAELPQGFVGTNFYLAYHGMNDRDLQVSWNRLLLKVCPSLDQIPPRPARSIGSGDRIRIGFVSGNLKDRHTIAKLNCGLMAMLPRDRFEVLVFDMSASADPTYLPKFADQVVSCSGLPSAAASQIAEARLDIAFFPDIGMHPLANRVAFSRLAPVQCTTWGHPVTTGLPHMDYFLSSELIEPAGAQDHYSEELVLLKSVGIYYYRPGRASTRVPSFPSDWNIYFCPQTLFKFMPSFDTIMAGILQKDPAARIVLIDNGGNYANKVGDRFSARYGSLVDRLVFLNRMSVDELLGIVQVAPVMLDTNPFGGGNTAYEAFAMGTPVVTLPADFMRGRVTGGLYKQMGIDECIVSTPDEYIDKAVRLATEPEYRKWVSESILERCPAIFEDRSAVQEIANFFEKACARAAGA